MFNKNENSVAHEVRHLRLHDNGNYDRSATRNIAEAGKVTKLRLLVKSFGQLNIAFLFDGSNDLQYIPRGGARPFILCIPVQTIAIRAHLTLTIFSLTAKAYRYYHARGLRPTLLRIAKSIFSDPRVETSSVASDVPLSHAGPDEYVRLSEQQVTGQPPVNLNPVAFNPSRVPADADYAIQVANSYVGVLPGGKKALTGKSVLELGPGPHFATSLILKCWGAESVAVADRFLPKFDAAYHGCLYREVAAKLKAMDSATDVSPLLNIAIQGHVPEHMISRELELEELSREFPAYFDITLSNAVMEHLYHPLKAIDSLYAVMSSESLGLHQVDFRDHRNFENPLEFLLLDEMSFAKLHESCHAECGSRIRPFQMETIFRDTGFKEVTFEPNMIATEEYMAAFLPRLSGARVSAYSFVDEILLRPISGRFTIRK